MQNKKGSNVSYADRSTGRTLPNLDSTLPDPFQQNSSRVERLKDLVADLGLNHGLSPMALGQGLECSMAQFSCLPNGSNQPNRFAEEMRKSIQNFDPLRH